ncbi:MAG: DUF6883 domain-containing protein [Ginsengibacter sp.]
MRLLPNYQLAEIPDEKIHGYCLNPFHERGKHKARIFRQVFGIKDEDAELLKSKIIGNLQNSEVTNIRENNHGTIYTVPLKICIFEREAEIITAWIIRYDSEVPQLITCYVNI